MFDVEPIIADHKDVIHDVVFDYYGRRMATCSSDQTVKVSIPKHNLALCRSYQFFAGRSGTRTVRENGA